MSKTISPEELHRRLQAEPKLTLIDVRTPAEFATVHVPAARNIPLAELDRDVLGDVGSLPEQQPVYLLCHSGRRATVAAEHLAAAGLSATVVVEGGTEAWEKAGLPVTRGERRTISIERQVRIGAGSLVLLGLLLGWFIHPYFLGLSAFVGAGLVFAGVTDWCGMGLLLAKAPWNQRRSP
jgi:rhodanese-related sulfurtransferase